MMRHLHPIAGGLALLTIAVFWLSTVLVELFGTQAQVILVKTLIPWGLIWLIPLLIGANLGGFLMAKKMRGPVVARKKRRAPILALNGLLVLLPAALLLAAKARAGDFDGLFYAVQVAELIAGAVNITLMIGNIQDGRRLSRPRPAT
ncbi:MAG: hypothetical protein ACRBBS_00345 [Thalassovita sp.]